MSDTAASRVFFSASPPQLRSASSFIRKVPSCEPSAPAWWPESLAKVA
jgi:hypothetical protein